MIKGTLKKRTFYGVNFEGPFYLKGERIISSMTVRIPKYEVPILAAKKKKSATDVVDAKIKIQDGVSNSFTRFQVGATLAGYLENQYAGR